MTYMRVEVWVYRVGFTLSLTKRKEINKNMSKEINKNMSNCLHFWIKGKVKT